MCCLVRIKTLVVKIWFVKSNSIFRSIRILLWIPGIVVFLQSRRLYCVGSVSRRGHGIFAMYFDYRCFRETRCLHLQGQPSRWRQRVPPKRLYIHLQDYYILSVPYSVSCLWGGILSWFMSLHLISCLSLLHLKPWSCSYVKNKNCLVSSWFMLFYFNLELHAQPSWKFYLSDFSHFSS
jgi:hypothetical protein